MFEKQFCIFLFLQKKNFKFLSWRSPLKSPPHFSSGKTKPAKETTSLFPMPVLAAHSHALTARRMNMRQDSLLKCYRMLKPCVIYNRLFENRQGPIPEYIQASCFLRGSELSGHGDRKAARVRSLLSCNHIAHLPAHRPAGVPQDKKSPGRSPGAFFISPGAIALWRRGRWPGSPPARPAGPSRRGSLLWWLPVRRGSGPARRCAPAGPSSACAGRASLRL